MQIYFEYLQIMEQMISRFRFTSILPKLHHNHERELFQKNRYFLSFIHDIFRLDGRTLASYIYILKKFFMIWSTPHFVLYSWKSKKKGSLKYLYVGIILDVMKRLSRVNVVITYLNDKWHLSCEVANRRLDWSLVHKDVFVVVCYCYWCWW